jgi:Tol biopolymer transport system component
VLENVAQAAIDRQGRRLALLRRGRAGLARADLWWSSPPGAEPTRELRPPFDELQTVGGQLRFSGDGQLLIWMYDDPGAIDPAQPGRSSALYVIPAGSGAPRKLRDGLTTSPSLTPFDWMPDNRHIVMARPDDHGSNRHLWLVDTISGNAQQLTATHTNETFPAVTPTGRGIAYASDEVDFDLVAIAPDGRARRSVLATARNEFDPAWSPAGDQFAFVTDRTGTLGIWARSRDGQWERPIVTDATFDASPSVTLASLAYSPDGRTLAYQRQNNGTFEIWLSPSTGGTPVRLINDGPGIRPYQDSPSWSPDGEWIVYRTRGRESSTLMKVRVGTSELIDLKVDVLPLSFAKWSPDGKWILCETAEGLSRVSSNGGDLQTLAPGAYFGFTWSDDSRHVYALGEGDTAGHLALVEIDTASATARVVNEDLGPIPVASDPIRGFTFAKGQGFLTSFANARSDIWLLEGFQQPVGWLSRLLRLER